MSTLMPSQTTKHFETSSNQAADVPSSVHVYGMSGTNAHAVLGTGQHVTFVYSHQNAVIYSNEMFTWWHDANLSVTRNKSKHLKSVALLGTPALLEAGDLAAWERMWPTSPCSYMAQHRVGSTPLVPGMAYLLMVREGMARSTTRCKPSKSCCPFLSTPKFSTHFLTCCLM